MHRNKLTTIYIVRHGETEWNRQGLLQGHSDSLLTAKGEQQAKQIAEELKDVHFHEVFSSDLLRAKRTAEIIALERKIAIKTTQALRERFYGRFEGKPYREINEALATLLLQYEQVSDQLLSRLQLADTETIEQAAARFITFLREIAVGFKGKTLLIVTHGGVMRYLLIHLGFATHATLPTGAIGNLGFVKLKSDGVDFFVKETKGIAKISND